MEIEKRLEIIARALEHYGDENQIRKMCEECAEVIVALTHYLEGRATREEVITELADVDIMLTQMWFIFGKEDCLIERDRKLERLEKRMREGR